MSLCNSNHRDMVLFFIDAVELSITQIKTQMRMIFLQNKIGIKINWHVSHKQQINAAFTILQPK